MWILDEPIEDEVVTGVDFELNEFARDNVNIIQVFLFSDQEGGTECGMINRSLEVEVIG